MDRAQAVEIARKCARAKPQSYYSEPFEPHEWVVDAILEAAADGSEQLRLANIDAANALAECSDLSVNAEKYRGEFERATSYREQKEGGERQRQKVLADFFDKYALGPKRSPSCLVCGKADFPWPPAIQHAELPGIVVCHSCRDAAIDAGMA